ncbi:predicted protein [Naegleria gruberi]|uniref:Predicted protein n=1 Tax=Naegleria gruberi TaxID=5762 RepID=D2VVN7_NAEGR|nr:uncharacterized protein NAEGRDRAFT_73084 [Naegleria gruberi]EFC39138.1 predicted protein [Naegleria gruberi]|eukprot:XP_002671882.1 predicted protein [Naegleria gruberi strain NEG-M]
MSKKFEEEWVDVKDDDGDWDDDGVIDDDYDEDKFQREYEQYMKSLSKPSSSAQSSTTTATKTTTPSTSNTTPTQSATTTTAVSATDASSEKSHPSNKHHHKRNVAHLKDHHQSPPSTTSPIKPSATSSKPATTTITENTPTTGSSTTSVTNAPPVQHVTTTTTTATPTNSTANTNQRPVSGKSETKPVSQPAQQGQSETFQNDRKYERRNIKQHKPQNERKKHRTEQETIEFIKILLSKLLSSYDKVYASTRLTPEIYENTRHKLLKNFSFFKNSENMQSLWVDILIEKVLYRGIAGTIASLFYEQLEENVSRLPQDVIVSIKKKIATKCQQLFKEEFIVQNKEKELEEEFKSFQKKSNTLKLVAKLISYHVLDRKIAFLIISSLLQNPTELNLKLVCEFLLEVGCSIDSPNTKTLMDGIMTQIQNLSKSDSTPKLIKLDLLKVLDSRERNKFANIDEQFMFIQHELKVIQLENELAELTENPTQQTQH